jgi:hypothetical protein
MNPFNPFSPAHVGGGGGLPDLSGWALQMGQHPGQAAGVHPAAYQAAMQAVSRTPAFQHLAHQVGQAMADAGIPAPMTATASSLTPAALAQVAQSLATTPPPAETPAYHGGPGAAYGGKPKVVERPLTDIREFPLGFGPVPFPGGTEASVISRPQVVFRGERLVIPSTVAPFFSVIDIKVGNRSQLVNSVALPAQMFIETAVGIRLSMDTAAVAQDVALIVSNDTLASTTFQAAIIGTAAQ